jgi:predicted PilT family ATPase
MKTDREGLPRKFITLICPTEKLPLLIGKGGNNVKIINQLLDANIEVLTKEEAEDPDFNLQYTKIDRSKLSTRADKFVPREEKTFHSTVEGLDSFEYTPTTREQPKFERKSRTAAPKTTSTDMDDFQFDNNDDAEDVELEEVSEDLE